MKTLETQIKTTCPNGHKLILRQREEGDKHYDDYLDAVPHYYCKKEDMEYSLGVMLNEWVNKI